VEAFYPTERLRRASIVLSAGLNLITSIYHEMRPHDDFNLKSETIPGQGRLRYGAGKASQRLTLFLFPVELQKKIFFRVSKISSTTISNLIDGRFQVRKDKAGKGKTGSTAEKARG
jgi:hypothetical protein